MPQQDDARGRVVAQVDVVAAADPGDERVRPLPRVGALGDRLVQRADPLHPPEHVAAAIAARIAPVPTHRQVHRPARGEQVLHDLAAGGAGAHDEHRAARKLGRIPVAARVHLDDPRRNRVADGRQDRLLVGPGGDDNVGGLDVPLRGLEVEAAVDRTNAVHAYTGSHGGIDELAVALDEGDHLVAGREAIRPVATILVPGEPEAPVGELEHQRVPALAPPALGHPSPLENHVRAPEPAQVVAERESGVPPAHDHCLGPGRHNATRLRRCDCLVNLTKSAARDSACGLTEFGASRPPADGEFRGGWPARGPPPSGESPPPLARVDGARTAAPSPDSTSGRAAGAGSGQRPPPPCARPRNVAVQHKERVLIFLRLLSLDLRTLLRHPESIEQCLGAPANVASTCELAEILRPSPPNDLLTRDAVAKMP